MLNRRQLLKRAAVAAPAVLLTPGAAATATASHTTFPDFPGNFRGPVLRPGDPSYDTVKQLWNAVGSSQMPALIARAKSADDVVVAMRYAHNKGVPVAVRSGGHGIECFAMADDALVIDMSLMKSVTVTNTGKITAQAGLKLGEVTAITEAKGWVIPAGTVSSVGLGGLALGGGIGHLTRRFGLTVDQILSIDVVTTDGRKVTASPTSNAELFWGLRGAGQNLAVATSFTIQGRKLESVKSQDLIFPPARAHAVLSGLHEAMANSPLTLSITPVINRAGPNEGWPAGWVGLPYVLCSVVYTGAASGFDAAMSEFRRICGPPLFTTEGPSTYAGVTAAIDPWFPSGVNWKNGGGYVNVLSSQVAQVALDRVATAPPHAELHFPVMGGALFNYAEDSVACSRANANWMYEITAYWEPGTDGTASLDWVAGTQAALNPHTLSNGYINLNPYSGPDSVRPLYGSDAKWQRIKALKQTWDPTNRLRYNKNILP